MLCGCCLLFGFGCCLALIRDFKLYLVGFCGVLCFAWYFMHFGFLWVCLLVSGVVGCYVDSW